jgi:hypothetical protein
MLVLDSQYTDGGRIAAERFVAEEYIIDLLGAFDSHRCAAVALQAGTSASVPTVWVVTDMCGCALTAACSNSQLLSLAEHCSASNPSNSCAASSLQERFVMSCSPLLGCTQVCTTYTRCCRRVELAQMLCSGLPLPYDYSGLLCETLFAQLLRLPSPRLCPVAFSALIAHAALLRPAFPKYLAGSVRQLYLRLQFLAPELADRLADVLAHFITNMNFRWGLASIVGCMDRLPYMTTAHTT